MNPTLTTLLAYLLGLVALAGAGWIYSGRRRADEAFEKISEFAGEGAVVALVPAGLALLCFGTALAVQGLPWWARLTDPLLVSGFVGLLLVIVLVVIWHPKSLLPEWAQEGEETWRPFLG